MKLMKELGILEGILFVVGDEGIDLKNLCEIMEITDTEAKLRISFLGEAFKLTTKQEHKKYYEKLVVNPETNKLSQAALETLAIIAYNQPITCPEVNEIRGVQTNQLIRKLVAKGLIKEDGKSDMAGRPNLYKTTSEFLDYFGLATIEDLPVMSPSEEKNGEGSETELFTSIYKDNEDKQKEWFFVK